MLNLLGEFSLPLDEAVHLVVVHRLHELEGNLVVFGQDVHDGLNTLLHHFQNGFFRIHLRFLLQVAHAVARGPDHLSLVGFLHACDNFEQGGLTGAVKADNADLGPVEEAQVDVFEDDFIVVGKHFPHTVHRENNGFVCHSHSVFFAS